MRQRQRPDFRVRVGADLLVETEGSTVVRLERALNDNPRDVTVLVAPDVPLEQAAQELRTLAAMLKIA